MGHFSNATVGLGKADFNSEGLSGRFIYPMNALMEIGAGASESQRHTDLSQAGAPAKPRRASSSAAG